MKALATFLCAALGTLHAGEKTAALTLADHQPGSLELADSQDELAADVQQLVIEQTHPKVIELLESVEATMGDATDLLAESDTGGPTIAAQTDVIEKILAAAEEKQQQQGQGSGSGGAMLDMMREMAGKGKAGGKPGKPGQGQGDKAGQGQKGDSSSENTNSQGSSNGKSEERRVPKASGKAGQGLPQEFQSALDAYNRAAEPLAK